ncbi:MAG: GvpL/GvpF family gas vesicle protein [Chloroflexi bacterium]|nr:GvpL/GvpF family gas vesicle protein [Chloroflexota bacterium]
MSGKYIYGIIDSSDDVAWDISGLGNRSPVHTIADRGIACVLSDYDGDDFGALSKEQVVRYLLAHQTVLENVIWRHTVLPVKFGTILTTSQEVNALLSEGHSIFTTVMALYGDKWEIEVVATWNVGRILQEISVEPEIMQAKQSIASHGLHQNVEERIRLGQMVKTLMDRRRDSYRERMMDFLKPLTVDVQPNALVSDELVMNVAFLVEKSMQEEFDSRVKQLDDLFQDQINFRVLGPMPPYSFATIEVKRSSMEEVEEAKQLLELDTPFTEPEVRKAYRRLAAQSHPDHHPGDDGAKLMFANLRHASDVLITHCRGQATSGSSLLINIKRFRDDEVRHVHFSEAENRVGVASG